MSDAGAVTIGGLAIAAAAIGCGVVAMLGDAIGREIEAFFGAGGCWADEARLSDNACPHPTLSPDERGFEEDERVGAAVHSVGNAPETVGLHSGRSEFPAGVAHD